MAASNDAENPQNSANRTTRTGEADTSAGGAARGVGASWSGQELRRTLEQERAGLGSQRRPRSHTEEVLCPQQSFRDSPAYSPISPASSVASINQINLGNESGEGGDLRCFGYGAGTLPSPGRPWASPAGIKSKARAMCGDSVDGDGDSGPAGTLERFEAARMEGSWSEEEDGNARSGAAMRLAFSPRRNARGCQARDQSVGPSGGAASRPAPLSRRPWHGPFSPVKDTRPRPSNGLSGPAARSAPASSGVAGRGGRAERARGAGRASGVGQSSSEYLSLGSPLLPKKGRAFGDEEHHHRGGDMPNSPEEHSLHSVRDLMDDGTDEEDGAGAGGGGRKTALVRRRRRRSHPELALRALEMPEAAASASAAAAAGDVTVVEDAAAAGPGSAEAELTTENVAEHSSNSPRSLTPPGVPGKGGQENGGPGPAFGASCPNSPPGWECVDGANAPLESLMDPQEATVTFGDESWIGGGGREGCAKRDDGNSVTMVRKDWEQDQSSSAGFNSGTSTEEAAQDLTGLSRDSGAPSLGMSALSAADTSGASDSSTSFVKSRPIPDQVSPPPSLPGLDLTPLCSCAVGRSGWVPKWRKAEQADGAGSCGVANVTRSTGSICNMLKRTCASMPSSNAYGRAWNIP